MSKHDIGIKIGLQSMVVREKAAYVRSARRKLKRISGRKFDIESEIINALAMGRLGDRTTTGELDAQFDAALLQVTMHLDQLRKSSPFEWRPKKGSIESELENMNQVVADMEARLSSRASVFGTSRFETPDGWRTRNTI